MSSAIVVPLDEMNQFAGQWRMSVTDMDAMVQQIARDIANISDNAKGLNDVRARGRTIGSQHRQLLDRGMAVHLHVTASVQRFTQADQELAGMVRGGVGGNVSTILAQLGKIGMLVPTIGAVAMVSSLGLFPGVGNIAAQLSKFEEYATRGKDFFEGLKHTCDFLGKSDTITSLTKNLPEWLKATGSAAESLSDKLSTVGDIAFFASATFQIAGLAHDWWQHKDDPAQRQALEARIKHKAVDLGVDLVWKAGYAVPYLNVALLTHDAFHFVGKDIGVNGAEILGVISKERADTYREAFDHANAKLQVKKWIHDGGIGNSVDAVGKAVINTKDFVVSHTNALVPKSKELYDCLPIPKLPPIAYPQPFPPIPPIEWPKPDLPWPEIKNGIPLVSQPLSTIGVAGGGW